MKKIIALITSLSLLLVMVPLGSALAYDNGNDRYMLASFDDEDYYNDFDGFTITLDQYEYEWTGDGIEPKVSIAGLVEGEDFEVYYESNVFPGEALVIILGIDEYAGQEASIPFIIKEPDKRILRWDDVELEKDVHNYTGDAIEPKVYVKNAVEGVDYEVTYVNNIDAGCAHAIIEGKGECVGKVDYCFKILPRSFSITSAKATGSFSATIKWDKQRFAEEYIIRYSKYSSMKNSKEVRVYSGTSKTLKKLEPNTKYYVQVRSAVVALEGSLDNPRASFYYSKWSDKKAFTTKGNAYCVSQATGTKSGIVSGYFKGGYLVLKGTYDAASSANNLYNGNYTKAAYGVHKFRITSKTKYYTDGYAGKKRINKAYVLQVIKRKNGLAIRMTMKNGVVSNITITS